MSESKLFQSALVMDCRPVAERGYRAMQDGKRLQMGGALNWLLVQSTRLVPRRLATRIVRRLQESR